ncbi:hypothetical protein A4A49_57316, partial [Nicotiana attenuata]
MDEAADILKVAQKRMKKYVDRNRRPLEFKVGDKVLLKLTLQIWKKIDSRVRHRALVSRYDGPPEVRNQIEDEIEKILDHRVLGMHKKNRRKNFLIQWKGKPEADATWEKGNSLWQFE